MARTKEKQPLFVIKEMADIWLGEIRLQQAAIDSAIETRQNELRRIDAQYEETIRPLVESRDYAIAQIMKLMKANKAVLFDGTDIVDLEEGRLIHGKEDKVKIPKTALDSCEAQGFTDVVKIVKSLDREAIEKWTDEKLFLIGATRKPKETFNYETKETKKEAS